MIDCDFSFSCQEIEQAVTIWVHSGDKTGSAVGSTGTHTLPPILDFDSSNRLQTFKSVCLSLFY
jgi:hypothetical protein